MHDDLHRQMLKIMRLTLEAMQTEGELSRIHLCEEIDRMIGTAKEMIGAPAYGPTIAKEIESRIKENLDWFEDMRHKIRRDQLDTATISDVLKQACREFQDGLMQMEIEKRAAEEERDLYKKVAGEESRKVAELEIRIMELEGQTDE